MVDRRAGRASDVPPRPGGYRARLRRPSGRDELPLGQGRRRRSARAQAARRVDVRPAGRRRRGSAAAQARQVANHAGGHLVGAADQGDADRNLRPRRPGRARFAQGGLAQRLADRADPRRAQGGQGEDPAVRSEPGRGDRDRGPRGAGLHGMAERAVGRRFHPADGCHDARHLPTPGDRSAAGIDRRHDHRAGIAGRRSGRGGRRHQSRVGPRRAARRGRLARSAETRPGHPLRHGHQLRRLPAAAAGKRKDGRVHLFAARRRDGLAGEQPHRVDDVHAAAGLLRAAGPERARIGRRRERLECTHGQGLSRLRRLVPGPQGDHAHGLRAGPLRRRVACCRCWARRFSPRTCTASSA